MSDPYSRHAEFSRILHRIPHAMRIANADADRHSKNRAEELEVKRVAFVERLTKEIEEWGELNDATPTPTLTTDVPEVLFENRRELGFLANYLAMRGYDVTVGPEKSCTITLSVGFPHSTGFFKASPPSSPTSVIVDEVDMLCARVRTLEREMEKMRDEGADEEAMREMMRRHAELVERWEPLEELVNGGGPIPPMKRYEVRECASAEEEE